MKSSQLGLSKLTNRGVHRPHQHLTVPEQGHAKQGNLSSRTYKRSHSPPSLLPTRSQSSQHGTLNSLLLSALERWDPSRHHKDQGKQNGKGPHIPGVSKLHQRKAKKATTPTNRMASPLDYSYAPICVTEYTETEPSVDFDLGLIEEKSGFKKHNTHRLEELSKPVHKHHTLEVVDLLSLKMKLAKMHVVLTETSNTPGSYVGAKLSERRKSEIHNKKQKKHLDTSKELSESDDDALQAAVNAKRFRRLSDQTKPRTKPVKKLIRSAKRHSSVGSYQRMQDLLKSTKPEPVHHLPEASDFDIQMIHDYKHDQEAREEMLKKASEGKEKYASILKSNEDWYDEREKTVHFA